ncbi:MAG: ThuA domain-containing protein [Cyclobacteriaceae bacterium]
MMIKPGRSFILSVFIFSVSIVLTSCTDDTPRILVFTKTAGFYHESIPTGIEALQKLGAENGFKVDTTKDASFFTESKLKKYKAVVFLSTTKNVLNADQQVAFERYIQAGGGFVGIHAAADTEYEWPWYNRLVGAYFLSHPAILPAVVTVKDSTHISTKGLPVRWERTDEWYNYRNIYTGIHVLAELDEKTYEGGENGANHPIAWYHEFDGGRSFYTGGGHTKEAYSEPLFLKHVLGGIRYAMGENTSLDYGKSYAVKTPEENRFTKTILVNDLNEPMELGVAPDGRVFFAERSGSLFVYLPSEKTHKLLHKFDVVPDSEENFGSGILGLTLDPDFDKNNYLYLFYTPNESPIHQNISRFKVSNDNVIDLKSEQILIKIPLEAEIGAHAGGSLAWDKDKNLYMSTGDNTVPFASDGYAPLDEIPGRIIYDAQRSAGNTNDLRGKILRIHPEPDGSYTIPEGNLFPKGTASTRPEIYAMGCRNPYRMSVDQETSIVYWGEIGPDAGNDGTHGPRGYDEINQAKKSGNFGWPYFVGDNKAYPEYDFAAKTLGAMYDPKAPVNNSVNNTGLKELPPAQKAMIWYPYAKSDEFPDVGTGGRSALAGPVYHFNKNLKSNTKFPEYFDKSLFIYDWMRNWVFAVRLDKNHDYVRMKPFMSVTGDFRRPIDLEVGPEGSFYMLEYGSVYGIDNIDARLVRIDYNDGNRTPVAKISISDTIGIAPLKVRLSGKQSSDFDDDKLIFEWSVNGEKFNTPELDYTFTNNGVYKITLYVSDPAKARGSETMEVKVGNTIPSVAITTNDNSTFFFDNKPFSYQVTITDKEDKQIDVNNVMIELKYAEKLNKAIGHQAATFDAGQEMIEKSDCKTCHQLTGKSIGPAFMEISKRYKDDKAAPERLITKIIQGGGGVWGEPTMSAHPQLAREDVRKIVTYILSLSADKPKSLPQSGSVTFKQHQKAGGNGRYVLQASYTDKGGEAVPLTGQASAVLRPARVQAEEADVLHNIKLGEATIGSVYHKSYFVLKNIDLKGIRKLTYNYASLNRDAAIEVHVGSPEGELISTASYTATGDWEKFRLLNATIKDPGGKNDLYFVIVRSEEPNDHMLDLDWIEFKQ